MEMLKDYVPEIGDTIYLVFKEKIKVEKRTVYHLKTRTGLIDAIKYAKAEGADYAFFELDVRTPIYSTKDASCVCVINFTEGILNYTYISFCIENIIKNEAMLFTRYYLSLIKPRYLIDKLNENYRAMGKRIMELAEEERRKEKNN